MHRHLNLTVLYTHGNSGNVGSYLPRVTYDHLLEMGVDVITWDPPGGSFYDYTDL